MGNVGALGISVWGKNLTDEEYVTFSFPVPNAALSSAYGTPRTAGIELNYQF